jgi:hypothetical protein
LADFGYPVQTIWLIGYPVQTIWLIGYPVQNIWLILAILFRTFG